MKLVRGGIWEIGEMALLFSGCGRPLFFALALVYSPREEVAFREADRRRVRVVHEDTANYSCQFSSCKLMASQNLQTKTSAVSSLLNV